MIQRIGAAAILAALAACVLLGYVLGAASEDPLSDADLVPAGVNNCLVQMKESLGLLDANSIVDFTPAEITELRLLPPRCHEPAIEAELRRSYPALWESLQTLGR